MSPPRPTSQAPPPTPRHSYTPLPSTPESPCSSSLPLAIPRTPALTYTPLPPHTPSPYPSPPSTCSSIHPSPPHPLAQPSLPHTSPAYSLHPVLSYSQHDVPTLVWDIRTDPTPASLQQVFPSGDDSGTPSVLVPVSQRELLMPATAPPVSFLCLSCGIVPPSSPWGTIFVTPSPQRNDASPCVTVLDVLNAVRDCMKTPITQEEWDALSKKQQNRVNLVFHSRWNESSTPAATRGDGVLRQDCLLQHTLWGGLTLSVNEEDAAVLSLRRPSPA
ncbi:hypothetical protein H0H92_007343 [Tricholoma furcatifolium]|nr:hypothetical protein H0H92_007343 [Tricholoma furcatifolium]